MVRSGFQAKDVMELTGLTYRQIDHWVKSEIVTPRETVQKGSRTIRIFNFENLVVIRAAMKLLDFGLGFPVVKKAAAWLQGAFSNGSKGQFLFVAEGDNLKFLSNDPAEIMELMRGKCVVTIDLGEIISQLKKDIETVRERKNKGSGQRSYATPNLESA